MGRKPRRGLDFFPLDVHTFSDIKIRKLVKYQGGKAFTVYALLLCIIYKDGYYTRWDEELPFIISEQTGFEEAYILEVLNSCMNIGLLDKDLYESHKILSSSGIQERYQEICKIAKRKCDIEEYSLISSEEMGISSEEMGISSEEMGINSEEMGINSEKMPQRKEKKSKVKKSSSTIKKNPSSPPPPIFASLSEEVEVMLADEQWVNSIRSQFNGMRMADLKGWLAYWANHCTAEGKNCHENLADAKSHFNRYLRIKWEEHQKKVGKKTAVRAKDAASAREREEQRIMREQEYERSRKNAITWEEYLRQKELGILPTTPPNNQ